MMDSGKEFKIKIRKAIREDCVSIIDLKKELAAHQNMVDMPMLSVTDLQRDGYDLAPPSFHSIVAEIPASQSSQSESESSCGIQIESGRIVGYALYFYSYSAWEGKALHLEDLCVASEFRNRGIGEQLIKQLAKIATADQCVRIQFEVLDWNPARKFYDRLGGWNTTAAEGRHNFRLGADQIKKLASS